MAIQSRRLTKAGLDWEKLAWGKSIISGATQSIYNNYAQYNNKVLFAKLQI